jgi:two-component system sensor histidine kinase ChvG
MPRRGLLESLETWYGVAVDLIQGRPKLYRETLVAGVSADPEVYAALRGDAAVVTQLNSEGELIISVAVPVQRFKAVQAALVLSTEGGDIDAVVKAERIAILRVALVALGVSAALSVLLAGAIARPLRRLADAADRGVAIGRGAIDLQRVRLPDYSRRTDEIGRLSGALSRMIDALYGRLEAIERFAADVSHEIKNPLTSLRSAVETLRRARTPEAQARLLDVITHDVRRLDRLVTDISNASRLDAELAREEMEPIDLELLLAAVADVLETEAAARGVTVVAAAPAEPLRVRGLESRLGQVFRNLAANALSFSPEGGRVEMRASRVAPGRVRVTVEDEGPGVPPDKREAIFERFWSSRPEGEGFGDHSGLGLSIARQIVEAHGGSIHVEDARPSPDDVSPGARFVVELPG